MRRRFWVGALRTLAVGSGLVLSLIGFSALGLVLHASLPAGRAVTASYLSEFLSEYFHGQVRVSGIYRLSANGLSARRVTVHDAYGNRVLLLSDLRARASLRQIFAKLLSDEQKVTLIIHHVRLERGEAHIVTDQATGLPTIEHALTPVPSEGTPSTRQVRVWLPVIEVGHAFGRGEVSRGAPTLETDLANIKGSVLVSDKGTAVDVERFSLGLRGLLGVDARGLGSFHLRHPGSIWGFFDGYFGEVQTSVFVRWNDDELTLRVDAPRAAPEDVRAIWQDYPLKQPASVHFRAHGPLESLDTNWRVVTGESLITAQGPLSLVDDSGIELKVDGKRVDLRALWPEMPRTSVDARASVSIWSHQGQVHVNFNGYTDPSVLGEHSLPALDVRGAYDRLGLSGVATLHEPGLPAKVRFEVNPESFIDLTLDTKAFQLNHPRLRPYIDARGQAEGELRAQIEGERIHGSFEAKLRNLEASQVKLARGRVDGTFRGTVDNLLGLDIDARISGDGFSRDRLRFQDVEAQAAGKLSSPRIQAKLSNPDGQALLLNARLRTEGRARVDDLSLSVSNQGADLSVQVARISGDSKNLKIDDLRISDGDSELRSDLELGPDGFKLQASGQGVDLDNVTRALGLSPGTLKGKLTIEADVVATARKKSGTVDLAFQDLVVGEFEGLNGQAHLSLDGRHLVGQGEVSIEALGDVGAAIDLQMDGPLDNLETWVRATGSSRLELYSLNLSYFDRFLPEDGPLRSVRGLASARVRLERDDADTPPTAFLDAQTRGLALTLAASEDTRAPRVIEGIELQLGGVLSGPNGQVSGSVRAIDADGALLSASGTAQVDLDRILAEPRQALDVLRQTSLEAVVVAPARELASLPEIIRPEGVEGVLSGRLALRGKTTAPVLSGQVSLDGLQGRATGLSVPVSVDTRFNYKSDTGSFGGSIEAAKRSQRVLWGNFSGVARLDDLLAEAPEGPRYTGEATLSLEALPLELLQPLSSARVTGKLDGVLALSKRGEQTDANAQLTLSDGSIQGVKLGRGELGARVSDGRLAAEARFTDSDGALRLAVNSKLDTLLTPNNEKELVLVDLTSDNYDAVLLLPFVDDLFSDLRGDLDANFRAELRPKPRQPQNAAGEVETPVWDAKFSGEARLRRGVIRPVGLGLEVRDADVELRARREDQYNVLEIVSVTGKARSDDVNLRANGRVFFDGLTLSHGFAGAGLDDVPFLVRGVRLADLNGQVGTSFRQDTTRMSAVVDIPKLTVTLPRSTGRSLIELEPNPNIILLQPLEPPDAEGQSGLPWHVQVKLGDDVRVQSATINLRLAGEPKLVLSDELTVDGKIILPSGGRVNVAGKLFVVEYGFIQFDTDDFSDPHINIRAVWRTPGGALITAQLLGTARAPELTLESDPPLPGGQPEIYALLFGGGVGDTDSNAASPALGAGATMLSEVLGNTPLKGVELRAGVEKRGSSGQSAQLAEEEWRSYSAAVPLSDEVWFEGSYKQEQRSTADDNRAGFSGTIDWRFKQDWALRTEFGQLGTGLDLLWQYRY